MKLIDVYFRSKLAVDDQFQGQNLGEKRAVIPQDELFHADK